MSKYVVAVSGGVDSAVMLDILSKVPGTELVVAHFDHGIRENSMRDRMFVEAMARKYGLPFEYRREELGPKASEELARNRRYDFLRSVAKEHEAQLATAHHSDDVVESIAINQIRGTGWRGLAVMGAEIKRPLLNMNKADILKYVKEHNLSWREDSTNQSDTYLRNRVRRQLTELPEETKRQLLALWATQADLKRQINAEVASLLDGQAVYSRYFFTNQNQKTATELFRSVTGGRLTSVQIGKALHAIKVAKPGKSFEAGSGVKLKFTARNFTVEMVK